MLLASVEFGQAKSVQHTTSPHIPGVIFGKAQQPGYPIFLLQYSSMQRELHLSRAVIAKESKLQSDAIQRHLRLITPDPSKPNTTRSLTPQQAQEEADRMESEAVALLSPAQKSRLREVGYQFEGAMGLLNPLVAQKIAVTAQERAKLQNAVRLRQQAYSKVLSISMPGIHATGTDPNVARKKVAMGRLAMIRGLNVDAAKILSAQQLALWKKMQGKPFPIEPLYLELPKRNPLLSGKH